MSFTPQALINIVTCRHCKGEGCSFCQEQGVYGEMEGQTLIFDAPLYLDIKKRRQSKQTFVIKRTLLYLAAGLIIFYIWKVLVFTKLPG
jgi:hypothetical protein